MPQKQTDHKPCASRGKKLQPKTSQKEPASKSDVTAQKKRNIQRSSRTLSTVVNVILALITISCAYHIYYIQRPVKSLDVALISYYPGQKTIVDSFNSDPEKRIGDLFSFEVKVINSGNQPIMVADFEKELVFTFPARVISTNAPTQIRALNYSIDPNPKELKAKLTVNMDQGTISLAPLLLNPDDQIVILFVVTLDEGATLEKIPFEYSARIAGISKIHFSNRLPAY